ncbi:metallophosphoesterase [Intrasporangium chromatireducens Q5-1]|uniref:Metallophosphoesterase n=1 Tax=Intrasporangium chromatireducens Q5-1 TaxID=584657 RepID=W9GH80_9MICO|nr:metallophosphoesterase [Intrasporangium chromatireducens Q5-1]
MWMRRAEMLGRWLAVLVICYLGGVAATNLAPTVVETDHYRAVLRLDVIPRHDPVLHAPTIVGDVDLQFVSPLVAPGLDVAVSVREEITGLLTRPDVSVDSLQPTDAQISDAIRSAVIGVGLRFVAGALIVALALTTAIHYAIRRRPQAPYLGLVASALAVTCVATGASTALTYQPNRFQSFTTTGVLGLVQRNTGMLTGLEARAAAVTPYVRNLLAVSQALQAKFVPGELSKPVAARFLLVSDIHGANQYSLLRSIINEEQIDAVIDSGDLINFGRIEEAETSGLFKSIESLGVPYIFVSGNHDQSSPTDRALLERLRKIPNVVLLQGPQGNYHELSFHGLRIAGFNDPRWFGDDNKDPKAKEAPAVDAFNRTMATEPEPDIVVTHEPYAATGVDRARILVNGHIHSADLKGNRIQVGTFTGGGLFSHYTTGEAAELTGQPYAFDIVTFGSSCNLTQLTRYSYRNLLEGRPAYDSIQVINGTTIDPTIQPPSDKQQRQPSAGDANQPARTCSRIEPTTTRNIAPLPEGAAAPGTQAPATTTTIPTGRATGLATGSETGLATGTGRP